MAEMESDIHGLDADLQAKTANLKLAHTRLETRTNRPNMDLCRDEVYISYIAADFSLIALEVFSPFIVMVCRCSTASLMKSSNWRPRSQL